MKKIKLIWEVLATVALVTSCALAPGLAGDTRTLEGKLVQKGSAPMPQPVLVLQDRQQWELEDVPAPRAEALQNRTVTVEGVVVRPKKDGILLPRLRVTRLTENHP